MSETTQPSDPAGTEEKARALLVLARQVTRGEDAVEKLRRELSVARTRLERDRAAFHALAGAGPGEAVHLPQGQRARRGPLPAPRDAKRHPVWGRRSDRPLTERVLGYLEECGARGARALNVIAAIGEPSNTVRATLTQLKNRGKAENPTEGYWRHARFTEEPFDPAAGDGVPGDEASAEPPARGLEDLLPEAEGGHRYPGLVDGQVVMASSCEFGCGSVMGKESADASEGVDPFGACSRSSQVASSPAATSAPDPELNEGPVTPRMQPVPGQHAPRPQPAAPQESEPASAAAPAPPAVARMVPPGHALITNARVDGKSLQVEYEDDQGRMLRGTLLHVGDSATGDPAETIKDVRGLSQVADELGGRTIALSRLPGYDPEAFSEVK